MSRFDELLDEVDLDVDLDDLELDRQTIRMLASLRRLIRQGDSDIMASLDNLTAIETQTSADLTQAASDTLAAIAALQATIDGLTAGAVTQTQIDTLASQAQGIDDAVNALDAAVKPAPPTA